MFRFNQCRGEGVFKTLTGDDFTIPPEHKLHGVVTWRINAGRQFFVCIHVFFLLANIDRLSAPSDRGRQTHRSEMVPAASGSVTLTAVRPAPFFSYLINIISFPRQSEVHHG